MKDPWLVGGNFNVIAHESDRTGRSTRDRGSITFFDMMLYCGLENAGFCRSRYTWTNGQVMKRFDRVLVNFTAAAFF